MSSNHIETSLGYPLVKEKDGWEINLTELKVFKGLSVLGGILGEIIEDRAKKGPGDLTFLYKINSNINPELIDLGITHIQIYGRSDLLGRIVACHDSFIDDLITVFGTLQRPSWRTKLHPETEPAETTSLVFPFSYVTDNENSAYQIVLERADSIAASQSYFLRLIYEDPTRDGAPISDAARLEVNDLKNRVYIAGSTRMAGAVRDNILNACNRGVKEYMEENRSFSHLFLQLEKTRLGRLEKMSFSWDDDFCRFIGDVTPEEALLVFKKMFLSFEAGSVCDALNGGDCVSVTLNGCRLTLYLSQLNRLLNIRINLPRSTFGGDRYLRRMGLLEKIARREGHSRDFAGIGIFLVHHITSEIVAFIEALRLLKADSIHTLFVKYGGVVPTDYLETLLEIPPDYLFAAGLIRKTTQTNRNYFTLSDYLSDMSEMVDLDYVLKKEKLDFFPAMSMVAGHMFLKYCRANIDRQKKVLLIEDGGYLAPALNQLALSGVSTRDAFDRFHVPGEAPEGTLKDWLDKVLVGSVEHTKNGYDRLNAVWREQGNLSFPTYSIAISDNKLKEESREVAHSILSAIESILHGNGLVLSQRKTVLMGAEGNIGRFLGDYLENGRLHPNSLPLARVDKSHDSPEESRYMSLADISEAVLLESDLFIGVTGVSLLTQKLIEKLVLYGTKNKLFFASGSTKTAEFSHLIEWLNALSESESPAVDGIPVTLIFDRMIDPQSGIEQGGMVTIRFLEDEKEREKTLYLLNDLTPVNFLYYGVPTETMDMVLSQLLTASLGMVANQRDAFVEPGLYAVDHEIDEWGNRK